MSEFENQILIGDVRERLRGLPDRCVQTCITSPPYWGLRDYGVDGQIGLEKTPEEYVEKMVAVFREVRRVLRDDGTLWLNLGDSYVSAPNSGTGWESSTLTKPKGRARKVQLGQMASRRKGRQFGGLKPKNLVGIPWRVAFALQADGWYLRSDIIWSKPNPMPECVTDRPTKAHEYVFLMTKSAKCYCDMEAIREQSVEPDRVRLDRIGGANGEKVRHSPGGIMGQVSSRNRRTVWEISTQPYPEAHFATFPEAVVQPCIMAGTSERGRCPKCGTPWARLVEKGPPPPEPKHRTPAKRLEQGQAGNADKGNMGFRASRLSGQEQAAWKSLHPDKTVGWNPSCGCAEAREPQPPVPCVVLDPFIGSGTTAVVARHLGRKYVGIELNPEYVALAIARIRAGKLSKRRAIPDKAQAELFEDPRNGHKENQK